MSKSEMIKGLQSLKKRIYLHYQDLWCFEEALDEAINTIEVSEDCISREDLRRSLTRPLENNNADEMYWKGWHDCTVAVETRIADAPSVVPKTQIETQNSNENSSEDCISRADWLHEAIRCEVLCTNPMKSDMGCDGGCQYDTDLLKRIDKVIDKVIVDAPSVIPSRYDEIGEID